MISINIIPTIKFLLLGISIQSIITYSIKLPSFSFGKKNGIIDLRSDTVTKPSGDMRTAMFEAEVGDDVFGEDPTVNSLEDRLAKLFQKESALFVPTGTMANLAAIMSWCSNRGGEMLLGDSSHIYLYEQAGAAQVAGVSPRAVPNNNDGSIDIDMLERSIRANNVHFPTTDLITIEDTHNVCGGRVLPIQFLENISSLSKRHNIPIHLDGTRVWNAATASKRPVHEIAGFVDSISVCLSKGLGAPAGSVLLGPKQFINKARRARKVLGGGMRQSGILAAAGHVAIDDFNAGILKDDHKRAKLLAAAINESPIFHIDCTEVETNIILVKLDDDLLHDANSVAGILKDRGLLSLPFGPRILRIVTHRNINDDDVGRAVQIFEEVSALLLAESKESKLSASESLQVAVDSLDSINENRTNSSSISESIESASTLLLTDFASSAGVNSLTTPAVVDGSVAVPAGSLGESYDSSNPGGLPVALARLSGGLENETNSTSSGEELPGYEEAKIHGMSVCDRGFCVILKSSTPVERYLPVLVTPSDPMSDGLDRERAETAESVTLLQLLQGIDVESHLPRDALYTKFNEPMGGKHQLKLKKVMIDTISEDKAFAARLMASVRRAKDPDAPVPSAAMNASLFSPSVPNSNPSASSSLVIPEINLSSSINTEVQLANVTTPPSNNSIVADNVLAANTGSSSTSQRIQKESESKNAFEVIALAIRHKASIEVKSNLLVDDSLSYDSEELKLYFPKMVEVDKMGFSGESGDDSRSQRPAFETSILSLPVSYM